ncbi:MAG: hypothetical protein EAZ06_11455 [Cytophagales bacterium]|nr:MAG: hypothetical protein EAZ06_11455 [Cytophagales bacterium]
MKDSLYQQNLQEKFYNISKKISDKIGEYRFWNMSVGEGNLDYYLPQDALKYCYLSTPLYK